MATINNAPQALTNIQYLPNVSCFVPKNVLILNKTVIACGKL